MPNPTPGGERRTDHRAYAVTCPRPKCSAAPWRACTGRGGKPLAEPHRERVQEERGAGTTAKQRTPTLGPLFEDETVRVVARELCVPVFNADGKPNLEGLAEVADAVNRRGKIGS